MPFSEPLLVVVDTSGSMVEMGKLLLAHNLLTTIRQSIAFGSPIKQLSVMTLSGELQPLVLADNDAIPKLKGAGRSDLMQLQNYLDEQLKQKPGSKVLMLSDGYFDKTQLQAFGQWSKQQAGLKLALVLVGVDADELSCEQLSVNASVFAAQDIIVAIQSMAVGTQSMAVGTSTIKLPKSVQDLLLIDDDSTDESDWDE